MKDYLLAIILALSVFISIPALAEVSVSVDRQLVSSTETLRLILEARGDDKDERPDLSVLRDDFDVLGSSQTNRMQIINGQSDSSRQWQITLAPKRTGKLIIPAITVGGSQTNPIAVEVIDATQTQPGQNQQIFLEASVDKTSPYVQEQIVLTVKLYHNGQLRNGSMSQPEIDNAVLEKIGDDVSSREQKNGVLYDVIQRRYAIFPQQSGTLTIPAILFEGAILDPRRAQQNNAPFGRGFFGDPFQSMQPTQTFRTRTKAINIDVKGIPANFKGKHWLPAATIQLQDQWSPDEFTFEVGAPVTRTITVIADGLTSSQLPALDIPSANNVNIYPDQTAQENRPTERGILGLMQQKFAILGHTAGTVTLPAVQIPWWNTRTQQFEVATLPERTITLSPSSKTTNTPAATLHVEQAQQTDTTASPSGSSTQYAGYWPWLSGVLFLLWGITLYLLILERRKAVRANHKNAPQPANNMLNSQQHLKLIEQYCRENNATATRLAIIDWAQHYWPHQSIRSLGDVIQQCPQNDLTASLNDLNQTLYTQQSEIWSGQALLSSLKSYLDEQSARPSQQQEKSKLPGLYGNT